MKRVGNLMEKVCRIENLQEAYLRAVKGKRHYKEAIAFSEHLDEELRQMSQQLSDGSYRFGGYRQFVIYEHKKRTISAACFRDRVAMHALMRVVHPVFDDFQIYDSYASRLGKGTYAALDRAQQFCRKFRWYVKLDVCKYFDSIDHNVLKQQLSRLFKDKQYLSLLFQLLDGYEVSSGCGLPIGNLTSQYFANHYLSVADHYLQEKLHVPSMVRYMDDMIFFANDKGHLQKIVAEYSRYLKEVLHLQLHEPQIQQTQYGIPFLGYVLFPNKRHLSGLSRHRYRRKMLRYTNAFEQDILSGSAYHDRLVSLNAFARKANSDAFCAAVIKEQGTFP